MDEIDRGCRLAEPSRVSLSRSTSWRRHSGWVIGLWLGAGLLILAGGACRRGVPVVDLGPKPPDARGTLTGIVRGPEGTSPMTGRTVEIINAATGEKHSAQTSDNGGFTIQLPAGKYRLEFALREGETLVKHPAVIDLGRGDIDSHIEFVVSAVPVKRSKGPAYRVDNGLGSPIA
jgi:Carboxypeptidase regulatory-like domain